jgi:DivIVA domain-containing protein
VHTLILLVAILGIGVVAAVAFPQAAGGGAAPGSDEPVLAEQALPPPGERVTADDVAVLGFPLAFRGYRPAEVEAVLDRLAAELQARDAYIADLENAAAFGSRARAEHVDPRAVGDVPSHGATLMAADDERGAERRSDDQRDE